MRVTVGALAVLGLTVTVATAQPTRERAAALKAPQALAPGELPVARGAIDDFPTGPYLSSTPVPRSNAPAGRTSTSGPAWLSGVDPNVLPAAGTAPRSSAAPLTPPALGKNTSVPPPPRMLDRLKIFPGEKPLARPVAQPAPQPQPTASTAFRGTGTNGTPVFAGPPAYRWYGWGSVTPGANPLAPAGQYPKASANWYSITGATPGAFPVPVSDPVRIAPGTEPPTYGLAARQPAPTSVLPVASRPQPAPQFVEHSPAPRFNSPPESKFMPAPPTAPSVGLLPPTMFNAPGAPAPSVPVLTPPPIPKTAAVSAPQVLPPPSMPIPSLPPAPTVVGPVVSPAMPIAPPAPATPKAEPVAALPPIPSVEPVKPAVETKSVSTTPAPLPTSVTTEPACDDPKWKRAPDPTAPRPGTWSPATNAAPQPTAPRPTAPVLETPDWQTGQAKTTPIVARGQVSDDSSDPVVKLIQQVCQDRASSVEIRWTGTKKLSVCFEIRSPDAAQKLVADISKRPELTAYQIDFCVLVK